MSDRPRISLIAALADDRAIGANNRLLWRLPADLRHFKRLTVHKPIVMGRKTWESLPGLLPHRTHIVITRNAGYQANGCVIVHSPAEAIAAAGDVAEIMVVGGAEIYRQFLPLADRMHLTWVHGRFAADAFFPTWPAEQWRQTAREPHRADADNPYDYTFVTLEREHAAQSG